jgi:hypothetical protein
VAKQQIDVNIDQQISITGALERRRPASSRGCTPNYPDRGQQQCSSRSTQPPTKWSLMARLWSPSIKDDPLAFVLLPFPWGSPARRWSTSRPAQVAARGAARPARPHQAANNGKIDFDTFRMAVASGRGIGKSALVSWLVIWMLSTRIGSAPSCRPTPRRSFGR